MRSGIWPWYTILNYIDIIRFLLDGNGKNCFRFPQPYATMAQNKNYWPGGWHTDLTTTVRYPRHCHNTGSCLYLSRIDQSSCSLSLPPCFSTFCQYDHSHIHLYILINSRGRIIYFTSNETDICRLHKSSTPTHTHFIKGHRNTYNMHENT